MRSRKVGDQDLDGLDPSIVTGESPRNRSLPMERMDELNEDERDLIPTPWQAPVARMR